MEINLKALFAVALLAGCAGAQNVPDFDVVRGDKDTVRVYVTSLLMSPSDPRAKAGSQPKAESYCNERGKTAQFFDVQRIDEPVEAQAFGADHVYRCV